MSKVVEPLNKYTYHSVITIKNNNILLGFESLSQHFWLEYLLCIWNKKYKNSKRDNILDYFRHVDEL
jgi:hypothetical protein